MEFAMVVSLLLGADVDLKLKDGSFLRGSIRGDTVFTMRTKYGSLQVPVDEVISIDFATRTTQANSDAIEQAIARLGSEQHTERERASKLLLGYGFTAARALLRHKDSPDAEIAGRVKALLQRYSDEQLGKIREQDVLRTSQFAIAGDLVSTEMVILSESLGELKLAHHFLASAVFYAKHHSLSLELNAHTDGWVDTGVFLPEGSMSRVLASGAVDLWPQTPGMHMASPVGCPGVCGKNQSPFPAGSLLGRIGGDGKEFLVGADFTHLAEGEGQLFLRIVGSPWNNASIGVYRVNIQKPTRR